MLNKTFYLLLLSLIPIFGFSQANSQYPDSGNKIRLGFQTSGDGLIWRDTQPKVGGYQPINNKAAWIILDTINNKFYHYKNSIWTLVGGAAFSQPVDSLFFNTGVPTNNVDTAKMRWDSDLATVVLGLNDNVPNELGFKNFWLVKNQTGSTITKGSLVYANGTVGASGRITVAKFIANGSIDAKYLLGITAHDLSDGEDGYVISFGKIRQVNTDTFAAGAILYPSPTVAGVWTDVEPVAPNIDMPIGFCINSSVNNGTIAIRVASGYKLSELHDVAISSPIEKASLYYSGGLWRDTTAALLVSDTASMLAPYFRDADTSTLNLTSRFAEKQNILVSGNNIKTVNSNNLLGSGNVSVGTVTNVTIASSTPMSITNSTTTPEISMPAASASVSGYLQATAFSLFQSKQGTISLTTTGSSGASTFDGSTLNIPNYTLSGLGGVPTSRTITINGTSQDLSANRIYNVGTVTSVSGTGTVSGLTLTGSVTGSGNLTLGGTLSLTSSNVTTALGYTPYNSTNPNGYITNSSLSSYLPLTGGTLSGNLNLSSGILNTWQSCYSNAPRNAGAISYGYFCNLRNSSGETYLGSRVIHNYMYSQDELTAAPSTMYYGRFNGFYAGNYNTNNANIIYDASIHYHNSNQFYYRAFSEPENKVTFSIKPSTTVDVITGTKADLYLSGDAQIDRSLNIGGTLGVTGATTLTGGINGNIKTNGVSGATSTPDYIWLGNNYSNGTTSDKLKIYLYNGITDKYGFTAGSVGDVQYHSDVFHDFYIANTKKFFISNTNTTTNNIFTVNNAAVFNEGAADADFRVESIGNNNMVFVDASTDRVGIGTNSPTKTLDVNGELKVLSAGTFGGRLNTNWMERTYSNSTSTLLTVSVNTTWLKLENNSTITLTLPNAADYPGKELHIKNAGTGAVNSLSSNIEPLNSTTIGTAILASGGGKWATLVSDGTYWVIMAGN